MALAAWLGRVRPAWLDLDGLLAVTLPPESTPRVLPQLLSAEILQFPGTAHPDRDSVLRNTRVHYLTPELNKRVSEYFGDPRRLSEFLAIKAGKEPAGFREFAAEAERLFPGVRDKRVRDLLRSTGDLRAFLRSIAARLIGELAGATSGESARDRKRLEETLAALAALPAGAAAGGGADDPRQRLERELGELMRKYHAQGPAAALTTVVTTQFTGGVSLSPRLFSVKKSARRPALEKLRIATGSAGKNRDAAGWSRSGGRPGAVMSPAGTPAPPALSKAPTLPPRPSRPAAGKRTFQPPAPGAALEELIPAQPAATPAMSSIAVPGAAAPAGSPLVGRLAGDRRIVFTRAAR